MTYHRVAIPSLKDNLEGVEARRELAREILAWTSSDPVLDLVASFSGAPPVKRGPVRLLDWLDEFSREHWDFRNGHERHLAPKPELTPLQHRQVWESANALGLLTGYAPADRDYDSILILGGLVRSCIARTRYAYHLVNTGIGTREVTGLCGFRSLSGNELPLAAEYRIDPLDEFQALIVGMKRAFGIRADPALANDKQTRSHADWEVATLPPSSGGQSSPVLLEVVAAPSSEPDHRRATTRDTYEWWARRQLSLHRQLRGRRILLVTNSVYVPYQDAVAIEVLGLRHGVTVESVGVPSDLKPRGAALNEFAAHNYLQEIRSAIHAFRVLFSQLNQ